MDHKDGHVENLKLLILSPTVMVQEVMEIKVIEECTVLETTVPLPPIPLNLKTILRFYIEIPNWFQCPVDTVEIFLSEEKRNIMVKEKNATRKSKIYSTHYSSLQSGIVQCRSKILFKHEFCSTKIEIKCKPAHAIRNKRPQTTSE